MDAVSLLKELVAFESTSSLTNVPITDHVERILINKLGFDVERLEYDDVRGVRKASIVAKRGTGTRGMAYFGHTDVVPADPWAFKEHGPFTPHVRDGKLFGRGSCDMKGSIACMLAAAARFVQQPLQHPLYITCTADEEIGYGGAAHVARESELFDEMCRNSARGVIGEPTLLEVVHAHKGTYGFRAVSHGRAAHSSTNKGLNANLAMIPFLMEMKKIHDELLVDPAYLNADFDPPTVSWNIGINDHTHAVNITAPQSICSVYFRPMPGMDADALLERARRLADQHGLEFRPATRGQPVYMDPKSAFVREVLEIAEKTTSRTVAYGTDGAMLTNLKEMVVLGPGSIAQAHTHDEWIDLDQLTQGTELYCKLIQRWCVDTN